MAKISIDTVAQGESRTKGTLASEAEVLFATETAYKFLQGLGEEAADFIEVVKVTFSGAVRPSSRYEAALRYGTTLKFHIICGLHVHTSKQEFHWIVRVTPQQPEKITPEDSHEPSNSYQISEATECVFGREPFSKHVSNLQNLHHILLEGFRSAMCEMLCGYRDDAIELSRIFKGSGPDLPKGNVFVS